MFNFEMKKVMFIFGTRPEAIKMAPVIKEFRKHREQGYPIEIQVCVTAQHREMLDQVLSLFDISPDYDLDIMSNNQNLFHVTSLILNKLSKVLNNSEPDLVFVHGDTTTTFVAALSAFYKKIKVAHVEAGLRTYDKMSPFPEEINRHLTGVIADFHFAPTENAKDNLIREGVDPQRIVVTGNTVIDALFYIVNRLENDPIGQQRYENKFKFLSSLNGKGKLILVTGHRRENFGDGLENICHALATIAAEAKNVEIVYPVHLNPNVQEPVNRIISGKKNIFLLKPLDYEPFVFLMKRSYLILTDSGGIQEEAPSLGKPVLVMRNTTERPEAVKAGTVKLVGTDKEKIIRETLLLLNDSVEYQKMSFSHNPYGDGKAAKRIFDFLEKRFLCHENF